MAENTNQEKKSQGNQDVFLRLPYGLAKSRGINTDGLTPRQVWQKLKGEGVSPQQEMEKLSATLNKEKRREAEAVYGEPSVEEAMNEQFKTSGKTQSKTYENETAGQESAQFSDAQFIALKNSKERMSKYADFVSASPKLIATGGNSYEVMVVEYKIRNSGEKKLVKIDKTGNISAL